jgi:type II restriction enzyme
MLLRCDTSIADGYTSQTQISRVISEKWLESNGYCLSCESDALQRSSANTKATDFVCPQCNRNYELKAFRLKPKNTLVDGAYSALMGRIRDGSVPTLLMLERNELWEIQSLTAVHHLFLTPEVVEQRKPLSATARRAGWMGCNIRLDRIANDARIEIISLGLLNDRSLVRKAFRRFGQLNEISPDKRGWTTLTLRIIRDLRSAVFTLHDLYGKEAEFAQIYPDNQNIRPKIRQQLQVLRDLGYLTFLGSGAYRVLF